MIRGLLGTIVGFVIGAGPLADAYTDSAHYLSRAVEFGMQRCDYAAATPASPAEEAARAAAAARRLGGTFRGYLAERGLV